MLAQSFRKNGAAMGLGSVMSLGGMPFHYVRDRYGDQVALPCTERNVSQAKTAMAMARGLMPVLSVKGRDEVRLASFQSLAGGTVLGAWSDLPPPAPKAAAPTNAAPQSAEADETDAVDEEMAALLAGFDSTTPGDDEDAPPPAMDEDAMDAELAALLASL